MHPGIPRNKHGEALILMSEQLQEPNAKFQSTWQVGLAAYIYLKLQGTVLCSRSWEAGVFCLPMSAALQAQMLVQVTAEARVESGTHCLYTGSIGWGVMCSLILGAPCRLGPCGWLLPGQQRADPAGWYSVGIGCTEPCLVQMCFSTSCTFSEQ